MVVIDGISCWQINRNHRYIHIPNRVCRLRVTQSHDPCSSTHTNVPVPSRCPGHAASSPSSRSCRLAMSSSPSTRPSTVRRLFAALLLVGAPLVGSASLRAGAALRLRGGGMPCEPLPSGGGATSRSSELVTCFTLPIARSPVKSIENREESHPNESSLASLRVGCYAYRVMRL